MPISSMESDETGAISKQISGLNLNGNGTKITKNTTKFNPSLNLDNADSFNPGSQPSQAIPSPGDELYSRLPAHLLLPSGYPDYLKMILTSRVYDILKPTALTPAVNLSARLGCNILLKREDTQEVFSFKIRGAYNFMAQLSKEERWKGVVTCSAGNHAQGVAFAGRHLNTPCTIVMPTSTPMIKIRNVERLGAKVILFGSDFDTAKTECARLASELGLIYVPPYDDPYVIAGQGTAAVEISRQVDLNDLSGVFAAIGGGGLSAGVSAYMKGVGPPSLKCFGGETIDSDAMEKSISAGDRVTLKEVGPFSDGTAVKIVGRESFRVCKDNLDEIVLVTNDEICAAIKDVFEETRSVPEPAGALGLAACKKYILENNLRGSGKTFVAIISGANMNFSRLRFVAERAELGERREVLLSVSIPERPGSFLSLIDRLGSRSVTEFSYRMSANPKADARICLSFLLSTTVLTEESRKEEISSIMSAMNSEGFAAHDLSDNELAKSHVRYMIGGGGGVEVDACKNERVFRFEFPERPGALNNFLARLKTDWNISMFNYRNYGGDVGKVLAAIQVPIESNSLFDQFLEDLNYKFVEETDNEVYKQFLCS